MTKISSRKRVVPPVDHMKKATRAISAKAKERIVLRAPGQGRFTDQQIREIIFAVWNAEKQ
jgi:hypothetical protein